MMPIIMNESRRQLQILYYLVITSLLSIAFIEALKCKVADEKIQQDFNDVVRTCMSSIHNGMKNNENGNGGNRQENRFNMNNKGASYTNRKLYSTGNQQQNNKRESYDEEEEEESDETSYPRSNSGGGGGFGNRYNNNNNNNNNNRNTGFQSNFNQGTRRPNHTNFSNSPKRQTSSVLEDIEPCIIHCVFRQMQLLDGDSKPDKSSVISVMTQKIRNPELKEFIQDSIMDCFEIIESGLQADEKCEFSKQFALCLEEKGQQNCEDWSDEDKKNSSKQQSGLSNKNNQNVKSNNPFRG